MHMDTHNVLKCNPNPNPNHCQYNFYTANLLRIHFDFLPRDEL